jgi:hypothetical protein
VAPSAWGIGAALSLLWENSSATLYGPSCDVCAPLCDVDAAQAVLLKRLSSSRQWLSDGLLHWHHAGGEEMPDHAYELDGGFER